MTLNEAINRCLEIYASCESEKCAEEHLQLANWLMELKRCKQLKLNESMQNTLDKDYLIESKATFEDLIDFAKRLKIDQWLKNYKTRIDMLKQSIRISRKENQDTTADKRLHDLNVTMNNVYKKFLELLKTSTKPSRVFKDLKKTFVGSSDELKFIKSLEFQFAFFIQDRN